MLGIKIISLTLTLIRIFFSEFETTELKKNDNFIFIFFEEPLVCEINAAQQSETPTPYPPNTEYK